MAKMRKLRIMIEMLVSAPYTLIIRNYYRSIISTLVLVFVFGFVFTPLLNYYKIVTNEEDYLEFIIKYSSLYEYFNISSYRLFLSILLIIIFIILFFIIYFEFIKIKHENKKIQNQLFFLFYINFLILFIALFLLIHSNNLLGLLLCIEIINMVLYFIIIIQNKIFIKNVKSNQNITEIVLKYFINNAFFTVNFLFGTSLIYFQTKSINFNFISNVLYEQSAILNNPITLLGIFFIFISFFIKFGFIGFHKLLYEVYNGFNFYTYNFIGIFIKFYIFQIFAIMYTEAFYSIYSTILFIILVLFTIISLLTSTIWAIFQKTIINFFFYSSISNYSLILLMVLFSDPKQLNNWAYYNFHYFLFSFLLFILIQIIEKKFFNIPLIYINQLNAIKKIDGWYTAPFALLMIILMGFPIFPIFLGKFYFIYILFKTFIFWKVIFVIIAILLNILLTFYYFVILLKSIFIDDDIKLDNSIFKLNNQIDIDDNIDNDIKEFINKFLLELEKKDWYIKNPNYYKDAIFTFEEIKHHISELNKIIHKFYFNMWRFFVIILYIYVSEVSLSIFSWWVL